MPITIDFNKAPDGLVKTDNQGKTISADLDRWRTIVAAMRNSTDVRDGQSPHYFTNPGGVPHLRGEDPNSAYSHEPIELASWIESKLPMKILSWNVGIGNGSSLLPKAWYLGILQKVINNGEYDIVCLQEVPNKADDKTIQIDNLNTIFEVNKYHISIVPRKPNGYGNLVVVTKKSLCIKSVVPRYKERYEVFAINTHMQNFSVSSIHLNRNFEIQPHQAKRLNPEHPQFPLGKIAILAGDFNSNSNQVQEMFDQFIVPNNSNNQIDHIICFPKSIKITSVDVKFRPENKLPGSHFPIAASITIP